MITVAQAMAARKKNKITEKVKAISKKLYASGANRTKSKILNKRPKEITKTKIHKW
ncbi:hypothetical protein CE91St44_27320 [Oscillospiraceae bacterium]|nr:hypothetical protein CE91St44_27320 [Oscillospiraceae bacterium]